MSKLEVKKYTQIDENLLSKWNELWQNSVNAHPFNSPNWFLACREAFGYFQHVIFVALKDGKAVGVFPLVTSQKYGLRIFASPGGKYLDKNSLLLSSDNTQVLAALLFETGKLGNLDFCEVEEHFVETLKKINSDILVYGYEMNHFVPNEASFLRNLDAAKSRRIENKLEKFSAKLRYEMVSEVKKNHIDLVSQIEAESSRRHSGMGTFTDPIAYKLYLSFVKYFEGKIRLGLLFYDEKAIAYRFGLLSGKTFYETNTAYLDGFQEIMPGKLLLYLMCKSFDEEGIELLDWLRGTSTLKEEFTPYFVKQYSVFYSNSIISRFWWKLITSFFDILKNSKTIYKIINIVRYRLLAHEN